MSDHILSHYSLEQFIFVLTLLLTISISTVREFRTLYYGQKKLETFIIWFLYVFLLLISLQIETSYDRYQALIYISVLRVILGILFFLHLIFFIQNLRLVSFFASFLIAGIVISSFYFHYLTLYLIHSLVFILGWENSPQPQDILVKKEALLLLENLGEPVFIASQNGRILHLNRQMRSLISIERKLEDELLAFIDKISKKEGEIIFHVRDKWFQFHYSSVSTKGVIFTGSDITEEIQLQNRLKVEIEELENLTAHLRNYTTGTEKIIINEEREKLMTYINSLVREGIINIEKKLEVESRNTLIFQCRDLLNQIRLVVSRWRAIPGDNK